MHFPLNDQTVEQLIGKDTWHCYHFIHSKNATKPNWLTCSQTAYDLHRVFMRDGTLLALYIFPVEDKAAFLQSMTLFRVFGRLLLISCLIRRILTNIDKPIRFGILNGHAYLISPGFRRRQMLWMFRMFRHCSLILGFGWRIPS